MFVVFINISYFIYFKKKKLKFRLHFWSLLQFKNDFYNLMIKLTIILAIIYYLTTELTTVLVEEIKSVDKKNSKNNYFIF